MSWSKRGTFMLLFLCGVLLYHIISSTFIGFLPSLRPDLATATIFNQFNASKPRDSMHSVDFTVYCDLLKRTLTGYVYPEAGGIHPKVGTSPKKIPFNAVRRWNGLDWPFVGHTMIGIGRLSSLQEALVNITSKLIKGDFLEAGVWRGGTCIFARLVLDILDPSRKVWVFDSFSGLPPSRYKADGLHWDHTPYLEVSLEEVKRNFRSYGIDVDNTRSVQFVKGFFNETMPLIYKEKLLLQSLSVLRMDGDMYESTIDIMFNSWHKLSIDGVVIVDDWKGFPAQTAVRDFYKWHDVSLPWIHDVDVSAYFIKESTWIGVDIKMDIYYKLLKEAHK